MGKAVVRVHVEVEVDLDAYISEYGFTPEEAPRLLTTDIGEALIQLNGLFKYHPHIYNAVRTSQAVLQHTAGVSDPGLTNEDLEWLRALVVNYQRAVARNEFLVDGTQRGQDKAYAYTQELIIKLMALKRL